ncbi:MAG: hypothetical protein AAB815_00680 [Patescibacteria group bacterium]
MPKNFFQDMVKIKRENAQSSKPKVVSEPPKLSAPEPREEPTEQSVIETKFASVYDVAEDTGGKRKSPRVLWLVAGVSVLFLFFALSFLFSGAKVNLDPRIKDLTLNKNFLATKDSVTDNLPFDLIAMSGEESITLKGGAEQEIKKSAEGVVILYNTFSSVSQNLDINTRLEGSNGKIYKTKTKVTVPGMTEGSKPGSVEVAVYAAEAGEVYNSGPLDFTILGFKGTPKYLKFYARSKGEITGGLSGKFPMVADAEKETALSQLKENLKAKLVKKATDTIPSGFVLFPNAVFLNIDNESTGLASTDGLVPFSVKGTLYGFLFEEKKLTQKIVENAVPEYDDSEVYISNLRNLVFTLADQDAIAFKDIKNITFNLSGNLKVIWKLDEEKIMADMLGKRKKDFTQILSMYPNIVSADVSFHPFWKRSFPQKAGDLKLIVNYPNE